MIAKNLAQLSTEFSLPQITVKSASHTENGVNYAMISLTHIGNNERQHMGIALDFSTSMAQFTKGATKKETLIRATQIALQQMNDNDIVTIVVYGGYAEAIVQNAVVSHPDTIPNVIKKLKAHEYMGRTNPAAALNLLKECNQTLLLSDGSFNDGPTNPVILHGIVQHPILCGSIVPGTDMSDLSNISEGTYFTVDCQNPEHMYSLMASALSAPPIQASNVVLMHGDTSINLPSIRNGCSVHHVLPIFGPVTVTYLDHKATPVSLTHTVDVTGSKCHHVRHVLALQTAAALAAKAIELRDQDMQSASTQMFRDAGVNIGSYEDLRRESSSHNNQFSIDPNSEHCPHTCRTSSQSVHQ
jgi:hypothetical protein